MPKTLEEQLEEVQDAISEIVKYGQSSTHAENSIMHARLEVLERREEKLQVKINKQNAKAAGKSTRSRAFRLSQK